MNCKYCNIVFDHLQNFSWLWNFNYCFLPYSFKAIPVTRLQLKILISIIHNSLDLCPFSSRSDYIPIHGLLIWGIKQVAFIFYLFIAFMLSPLQQSHFRCPLGTHKTHSRRCEVNSAYFIQQVFSANFIAINTV